MQKYPGSLLDGFTQTEVSTLAVKNNLLVAGGFQGELICKVSNIFPSLYIYKSVSLICFIGINNV